MRSKTTLIPSLARLDEADHMQRPNLGSPGLCAGNVVQIERVLRLDVAADVAVAEMNAGPLLLPVVVLERCGVLDVERVGQIVVPFGMEGHRQRCALKAGRQAGFLSGLLQELVALRVLARRDGLHGQHVRDLVIVRIQLGE